MRALLAPSLARRVVLALLLAFGLAFIVLMAVQYRGATDPRNLERAIGDFGRGTLHDLATVDDPAEARGLVSGLDSSANRTYRELDMPSVLAVQVWDRDGHCVYASAALRSEVASAPTGRSMLAGTHRILHVFRESGPRWTVVVGQPEVPRSFVLKTIAVDLGPSMLIALPCVLLPLWLAVWQGLRPLRRLSRAVAERDPDDLAPTGLVARHRELRPLVRAIDDLLDRLRAKVRREQGFVHDAAHELRTPMAVISAQVHELAQAPDAPARREAEARLDDSIARASRLVDQLLALARLDDSQAPRREMLDVAALAQQELALLVPRAIAGGLELSLDAPESLLFAVEVTAFRSILHNLVVNAIHYVPRGAQVAVSLAEAGSALVLRVADDGPGIARQARATVFDRFVRGTGHAVAGSGLGLAIVRQAARRSGGDVVLLEAPEGAGCVFEVTLPA
jgi:signal transduction histidine kinase